MDLTFFTEVSNLDSSHHDGSLQRRRIFNRTLGPPLHYIFSSTYRKETLIYLVWRPDGSSVLAPPSLDAPRLSPYKPLSSFSEDLHRSFCELTVTRKTLNHSIPPPCSHPPVLSASSVCSQNYCSMLAPATPAVGVSVLWSNEEAPTNPRSLLWAWPSYYQEFYQKVSPFLNSLKFSLVMKAQIGMDFSSQQDTTTRVLMRIFAGLNPVSFLSTTLRSLEDWTFDGVIWEVERFMDLKLTVAVTAPHSLGCVVCLLDFESVKSLGFRHGNVEARRRVSITNVATSSHSISFSGVVKEYPNSFSKLSARNVTYTHQPGPFVVDIVIYSLLDSHSPSAQVNAKSSQLDSCHQSFYGAKQHRVNVSLLLTIELIVQECCFARIAHDYLTAASLTHYAVSSIDGSSQNRNGDLLELFIKCFRVISSQLGLRSLNVVYGSGDSHLKFLPVNIASCSYRCFNVVFDYQLFEKTITMGSKVELLLRILYFAEHDSPLNGSIFKCIVLYSSFLLPSSMSSGSSVYAINVLAF